mmetsp:Transcript_2303/g.4251  ORF Transcript_2303/g.4251 Transcript_2303/m.4251 type:complete len:110 (-) Transcript_2303:281-610(-)
MRQIKSQVSSWSDNTVYFGSKDHFIYALRYMNKEWPVISDDDPKADDDTPVVNDVVNKGTSMTAAAISGITIGTFLFCVLILCLLYLLLKTKFFVTHGCKKEKKKQSSW